MPAQLAPGGAAWSKTHGRQLWVREGIVSFLGFNVDIKKAVQKTGNSASVCPADKPVCDTTLLMNLGGPRFAVTGVVLV